MLKAITCIETFVFFLLQEGRAQHFTEVESKCCHCASLSHFSIRISAAFHFFCYSFTAVLGPVVWSQKQSQIEVQVSKHWIRAKGFRQKKKKESHSNKMEASARVVIVCSEAALSVKLDLVSLPQVTYLKMMADMKF